MGGDEIGIVVGRPVRGRNPAAMGERLTTSGKSALRCDRGGLQAELAQDLLVVLAERRRRRVDARAAMGELEGRERHAETALDAVAAAAWRWMTPRVASCGSAIASPMVRTRAAGTWRACRNASHSSAVRVSMISASTAISRSWSASRSSLVFLIMSGRPSSVHSRALLAQVAGAEHHERRPWSRTRRWSRADGGCRAASDARRCADSR